MSGGQPPGDEAGLLERARRGDSSAFGELVDRSRQRVFMIALHITRNEDDALDVAQDAYIRAWKALGKFDGAAPFASWVSRIASNAAIDLVRRRQAHPQTEFEHAPMAIDAASRTTPSRPERPGASVDRAAMRDAFEAALEKLSPEHRAVILLKEVEDLTYQEIADSVGCSIGTVMSRLFYARKKMQSELEEFYGEL